MIREYDIRGIFKLGTDTNTGGLLCINLAVPTL